MIWLGIGLVVAGLTAAFGWPALVVCAGVVLLVGWR